MAPAVKWLRPEHQSKGIDALETSEQCAERHGRKLASIRSLFTNYANLAAQPVALVGRLKYFLPAEMDDFIQQATERDAARTPLERAQADLVRIQKTVIETEERVEKRKADLVKAQADLRRFREQLRLAGERVEMEKKVSR